MKKKIESLILISFFISLMFSLSITVMAMESNERVLSTNASLSQENIIDSAKESVEKDTEDNLLENELEEKIADSVSDLSIMSGNEVPGEYEEQLTNEIINAVGSVNIPDDAIQYGLGNEITDTADGTEYSKWYKFKLIKAGIFQVSSSSSPRADYLPSIFIYDKDGNRIFDMYGPGKKYTGLIAGQYYFRVSGGSLNGTMKYVIRRIDGNNNFQSVVENYEDETTRNNTLDTAKTITPGQVYHGILGQNNAIDWYRFTVDEETYVKISQVTYREYDGTIEIKDSNQKTIIGISSYTPGDIPATILKPGSYYVYAERFNSANNPAGVNSYCIVLGNNTSEEYTPYEPDDAEIISMDSMVNIDLSSSDSNRWFQVNLEKSSVIKASISHTTVTTGYIPSLRIYDLTNRKLLETSGPGEKYIALLKGIYYVHVNGGNLTTGIASFKLQTVDVNVNFQSLEESYYNINSRNDNRFDADTVNIEHPYNEDKDLDYLLDMDHLFYSPDKTINGIIGNNNNNDWYKVTVSGNLLIDIEENYYANYSNSIEVLDENLNGIRLRSKENNNGKNILRQCYVKSGTYYIHAERYNYHNAYGTATAMSYRIGLTEILTVPLSANIYYDQNSNELPTGLFYYKFNVDENNTVMNISVDFKSNPTISEYVACLTDLQGNHLTLRDDGYNLINNPQSLSFHEGENLVFRRIRLNEGDYYLTIKQTHKTTTPVKYGFSDNCGIYLTTYREGFDLTKYTSPAANEAVLLRLKRDSNDNLVKDKDGNCIIPEKHWIDVFGEFQTKAYDLSNEKWGGYCCGMATSSLLYYENKINLGINLNNWKDFYTEKGIQYPSVSNNKYNSLEDIYGNYQIWQYSGKCQSERKTNEFLYKKGLIRNLIDIEKVKTALENNKNLIFTIAGSSGVCHTVAVDSCRNILKIPDPKGKGNDTYRLYLYDCNYPFYYDYSVKGCPAGCLKGYDLAENRYIDISSDGNWVAHNIGANANSQTFDVSSRNSLGLKTGDIYIDDTTSIPSSFNGKEEYSLRDKSKIRIFNKYVKDYAKNNGLKVKKKDGLYLFEVNSLEDLYNILDNLPYEVYMYYIAHDFYGDTQNGVDYVYEIPNEDYSFELTAGDFEILRDGNLINIGTNDKINVDMLSGTQMIISGNEKTSVNVVVSEVDINKETYNKVRTKIKVDADPFTVGVTDGKLTIDTDENQILSLELETESGNCVLENISTDELKEIDIKDHITSKYVITFDAQGGTPVEEIRNISSGTTISLPFTTRENYSFGGWFTEINGKGIHYTNQTPITKNVTLYAYWKKEGSEPDNPDIPDNPPEGIWIKGLKVSYPYTGSAIKPEFKVYRGKTRLYLNTDYTLKYKNNTKPGTASITIKMKGNYSGSKDVTFMIDPSELVKDISADSVYAVYKKNKVQKPKPELYINGSKLKYGKNDLTFTYPSEDTAFGRAYMDPGTYKIHIAANNKNVFKGEMDVDLVIAEKPLMKDVSIKASKNSLPYNNGNAVSPVFTLTYKGKAMSEGTDYTVSYADDHTDIGKHIVTFIGNNKDYFGKKTVTFNITGKYDLTSDKAEVKLDTTDLNPDNSAPFTYGGAKPGAVVKYNGVKLTAGKDYTISYSNNKNLGTATATIKGKGSYTGRVPKEFTIKARDINSISLNLSDVIYSAKKDAYKKTSVVFVDKNNKNQKLKLNTDYTLSIDGAYGDAPVAGTEIKVIIQGNGNYTGTINSSYRIIDKEYDFTKAKIVVNDGKAYDYTGGEIKPLQSDMKVTLNNTTLKTDDYEILGYFNNIRKGNSAFIKLRGKGKYGGGKMIKFKIGAAPIERLWSDTILNLENAFAW